MNTKFSDPLRGLYHRLRRKNKFRDSQTYWKDRYKDGGNSGWGSYDKFAEFKAEVINQFISKNDIKSAIEFGCGDGNQCKLFNFNRYIGIDISETVIDQNRRVFLDDQSKEFYVDGTEKDLELAEIQLGLSLDVIYHLVEDDVYEEYMHKLFNYKYVIVYSSNFSEKQRNHVRHRQFSDWVENSKKDWQLIAQIKNRYPFDANMPEETSPADFFIYHNPRL